MRPGEQPPPLLAIAQQHNVTGALYFAEYYYRAFDWSIATNDAYLLDQISAETCSACQGLIAAIKELGSMHQILRGGRIIVDSTKVVTGHFRFASDFVVEVHIDQQAQTLQNSGEKPQPVAKAEKDTSHVFVSWVEGSWQILEIGASS